jgi:hypothetical protein
LIEFVPLKVYNFTLLRATEVVTVHQVRAVHAAQAYETACKHIDGVAAWVETPGNRLSITLQKA